MDLSKTIEKWMKEYYLNSWSGIINLILSLLFPFVVIGSLILFFNWLIKKFTFLDISYFFQNKGIELLSNTIFIIFYLSLIILTTKFLFNLFFWSKNKYYDIRYSAKRNKIIEIPPIDKWIYQGSLKKNSQLETTSSFSGCLIKKPLFKDFDMSFNLKIENGGRFGIIFRAQDLENYLMLQIELDDKNDYKIVEGNKEDPSRIFLKNSLDKQFFGKNTIEIFDYGTKENVIKIKNDNSPFRKRELGKTYIRIIPHIRFRGDFETFSLDNREPYYDTELEYSRQVGLSIKLKVRDYEVTLQINNKTGKNNTFLWNIPTHFGPNIFVHNSNIQQGIEAYGDQKEESTDESLLRPKNNKYISEIWFKDLYGKIGFRAFSLEKGIVSDLKIEGI